MKRMHKLLLWEIALKRNCKHNTMTKDDTDRIKKFKDATDGIRKFIANHVWIEFAHVVFVLLVVLEVVGFAFLIWKSFHKPEVIEVCSKDYDVMGCYEERSPQGFLLDDWSRIYPKDVFGYTRRFACKCGAKARKAGYAGFSLYHWGECYGRSQKSIQSLVNKKENTSMCTGDRSYKYCDEKLHAYCLGKDFAEAVYIFKPRDVGTESGQWQSWTSCHATCGRGLKQRTWKCKLGKYCSAPVMKIQLRPCRIRECEAAVACRSKHIGFQTHGNGALVFIDRHHLKCKSNSAISMFHLQRGGHLMRYEYSCCLKGTGVCSMKAKVTEFTENGKGDLFILHKHRVNCGPTGYISQFHVERNQQQNQLRYKYYCCSPQIKTGVGFSKRRRKAACHSSKTHYSKNGKVYYLDRHAIICQKGYALTSFFLEGNNDRTKIRYSYRCCKFY